MSLEDIIEKLGSFGRFQKLQYLLACYASVCCGSGTIILVYILNVPSHRCRVPSLGSSDHWDINSSLIESAVPPSETACRNPGSSQCFHSCQLYSRTNGTVNENFTTGCTDGFVFDKAEFIDTFPTELALVCDTGKEVLVATLMQSQLLGFLVGSLVSGILSDRFGRKPILIGSMLLMGLSGLATSLCSDLYSFWLMRFLTGTSGMSAFSTGFVLGIELIGKQARVHAGIVIEYAYAVGLTIAVIVAYLLRYWRWLNIAVSVLPLFSIPFIWLMEESTRWLISKDRLVQAEAIVRKAASVNGVELPDELQLRQPTDDDKASLKTEDDSFLKVFKTRQTAFMTVNVFWQWWVVALVYYGLSLGPANLPGDIYLTSFLNAVAEITGYAVPHLLAGRLGRRATHAGGMLLASVALGSTVFVELFGSSVGSLDWLHIILAMLGKIGITTAFGTVFLWTAEMFHTGVRQTAVGCSSTSARIGTLLAPFMADMRKFIPSTFGATLPMAIFGCLSLLAGLMSLLLPETLGIDLPQTMEDCRRLASWRRKSAFVQPQCLEVNSNNQFASIDCQL